MKKLTRPALDAVSRAALASLSEQVASAKDPAAEAKRLWESGAKAKAFEAIRCKLESMAAGRARCMYCEDSLGTDIEHFYPKTRYPRRAFRWDNYLLACSHCNSNRKRDQFPLKDRKPALIDPSVDDPTAHLVFLPTTGEFQPVGIKGEPSINVFGLNDQVAPRKLPQARRAACYTLQLLLEDYDAQVAAGNLGRATLVKQMVQHEPFPSVLGWLIAIAAGPGAKQVLRKGIPDLMKRHRIASW